MVPTIQASDISEQFQYSSEIGWEAPSVSVPQASVILSSTSMPATLTTGLDTSYFPDRYNSLPVKLNESSMQFNRSDFFGRTSCHS